MARVDRTTWMGFEVLRHGVALLKDGDTNGIFVAPTNGARASSEVQLQSVNAARSPDPIAIPIWRDPSPGRIGILLHMTGLLGTRRFDVESPWRREHPAVCAWSATCPVCGYEAHVVMVDPGDCFANGQFICRCVEHPEGVFNQRYDDGRYDEVYFALAERLGMVDGSSLPSEVVPDIRDVAKGELEQRLPQAIDIGRLPHLEVVAAVVRTLARVPEIRTQGTRLVVLDRGVSARALREPELRRLLLSVVHTLRNGRPCQVPAWLARAVLTRRSWPELPAADSEEEQAQAALVAALREAVKAKGGAVTATELLQLSNPQVTAALGVMRRHGDAKALGYALRELRAKGGGVQDVGTTKGVTRWTVSSPSQ